MSCHTVEISMQASGQPAETFQISYNSYVGNRPVFDFTYGGNVYRIRWNGSQWYFENNTGFLLYYSNISTDCPVSNLGDWVQTSGFVLTQFDIVKSILAYQCGLNFVYKYKDNTQTGSLYPNGTRNGLPTYSWGSFSGELQISYADSGIWIVTPFGNYGTILYQLYSLIPGGSWVNVGDDSGNSLDTSLQPCAVSGQCNCGISWGVEVDGLGETWIWDNVGTINGQTAFQYTLDGQLLSMWYDGDYTWSVTEGDILLEEVGLTLTSMSQSAGICCPINQNIDGQYTWESFEYNHGQFYDIQSSIGIACACHNEDRIQKEYGSIRLPQAYVESNRGIKDCCCRQLVLAGGQNSDISSAWIKLSDLSDECSLEVVDSHNLPTIWQPDTQEFVNEPNAFYWTVLWENILESNGPGCYQIVISYSIAGIESSYVHSNYELKQFSTSTALGTAKVSAIFDGYHEMEGINFTGSAVESHLRFYGFIGFRQPNFEIDNVIYSDRQMKRNLRENLNTYEIITEPCDECITLPLIELYLLSENELYISDYNAHNHSYRYDKLPVIVEVSPTVEYPDPFSRKAIVKCKVGDKFKNKRTYY